MEVKKEPFMVIERSQVYGTYIVNIIFNSYTLSFFIDDNLLEAIKNQIEMLQNKGD